MLWPLVKMSLWLWSGDEPAYVRSDGAHAQPQQEPRPLASGGGERGAERARPPLSPLSLFVELGRKVASLRDARVPRLSPE